MNDILGLAVFYKLFTKRGMFRALKNGVINDSMIMRNYKWK